MPLLLKLGFRNLLRNKKRTVLSALAIGIGLAALIFADGLILGMRKSMVGSLTETYMGQAQIYHHLYREDPKPEKVIAQIDKVLERVKEASEVKEWTTRLMAEGLVTSPANVLNVQAVGIDLVQEPKISRIDENVIEGKFLGKKREVLIGNRLAKKLDLQIGERLVLTVVAPKSDEVVQELLRVSGIYRFNVSGFDDAMVFVPKELLEEMLGISGESHELVLQFDKEERTQDKQSALWNSLKFPENELTSWRDLVPGVMAAFEMAKATTALVSLFLLLVVLIGIMNTLFMAIFERLFEFGVLQAVGTRPKFIFFMILTEAFCLGLVSVVFGILIAVGVGGLVNIRGIDYGGIQMAEATFTEPIFVFFRWQQFVYFPLELLVFTVIAAIYPALHAARLTIAESMKKSL